MYITVMYISMLQVWAFDLHQQSNLILVVELDIACYVWMWPKGCGSSKILVSNPTNALREPKLCGTTISRCISSAVTLFSYGVYNMVAV